MIKKCVSLILMAVLFFSSGCAFPSTYAIEDIQNILIVGIDVTEDGRVKMTAVVDRVKQSGEAGKEQVTSQVYIATGDTVFDAKRNMHAYSEKRISWYHLKYIIVGEEAARNDIGKVLDFFCENDENRFLHRLLLAKGMTASDLLLNITSSNNYFSDDLDSLCRQTKQTGEASEVHLIDYAMECNCKWTDFYLPVLEVADNLIFRTKSKDEDGGQTPTVKLSGYAMFRENHLAGYLSSHEAMGLNFAANKISSAELTVTDMQGNPVSLEVTAAKASIKPKLNGTPSASISVAVNTTMVEYYNSSSVTTDDYIKNLEMQQSEYIAGLIAQALQAAKSCRSDVFGIGSALYHAYPTKCEPYKENWHDVFSFMEITIKVESDIQTTFTMLNAPGQ